MNPLRETEQFRYYDYYTWALIEEKDKGAISKRLVSIAPQDRPRNWAWDENEGYVPKNLELDFYKGKAVIRVKNKEELPL